MSTPVIDPEKVVQAAIDTEAVGAILGRGRAPDVFIMRSAVTEAGEATLRIDPWLEEHPIHLPTGSPEGVGAGLKMLGRAMGTNDMGDKVLGVLRTAGEWLGFAIRFEATGLAHPGSGVVELCNGVSRRTRKGLNHVSVRVVMVVDNTGAEYVVMRPEGAETGTVLARGATDALGGSQPDWGPVMAGLHVMVDAVRADAAKGPRR